MPSPRKGDHRLVRTVVYRKQHRARKQRCERRRNRKVCRLRSVRKVIICCSTPPRPSFRRHCFETKAGPAPNARCVQKRNIPGNRQLTTVGFYRILVCRVDCPIQVLTPQTTARRQLPYLAALNMVMQGSALPTDLVIAQMTSMSLSFEPEIRYNLAPDA
jgi:hypothetical protein